MTVQFVCLMFPVLDRNKLLGGRNPVKGHSVFFATCHTTKSFVEPSLDHQPAALGLWRQHQRAECGRWWLTSNHIMSWATKSLSKPFLRFKAALRLWGEGHSVILPFTWEYCGPAWVDWPNRVHSLSMNIWKLGLHLDVGSNGQRSS